ncbi:alkylation response protein AidB-like acyl-CoA dehydrogenase [Nakamurella sp. UYEF19]|uniref:acyl-CoA dehydrogenase n=1 Tax=Nakamurella sp. UYEF19 TaxID=1756392 RepID=UPI0033970DA0
MPAAMRVPGVVFSSDPSGADGPVGSDLTALAAQVNGDLGAAIALARLVGPRVPFPGDGSTERRWEMLATIAAADLTAARVTEAHLDALAILAEAGIDPASDLEEIGAGTDSTWGVFAAEGAGLRVQAARVRPEAGAARWTLNGVKPWCSAAAELSHALITAYTDDGHRRLFAVALRQPGVNTAAAAWISHGLREVVSGSTELSAVPAIPVGDDEWYLRRNGFAWGGAGVAACWYGGIVGLARTMFASMIEREPGDLGLMHLGAVDLQLAAARNLLSAAAHEMDARLADRAAGVVMASRVRGVVVAAAEDVMRRVGHALGPLPLAQDEVHARRVADLQIYVRQHHAERDEAALGRQILAGDLPW